MALSADDPPAVEIRPADSGDLEALTRFRCSRGAWYEQRAEEYIRESVPKLVENRHNGFCTLVTATGSGELLAVGGYVEDRADLNGDLVDVNHIEVLGISVKHGGLALADGSRLSDTVLRAVMIHAYKANKLDAFHAIVANQNQICIELLERTSDWTQVPYGGIKYLAMTTRIVPEKFENG